MWFVAGILYCYWVGMLVIDASLDYSQGELRCY
jgi:hypothetical protein